MRILVDADACPVKDIIIQEAMKRNIEVIMYFDTAHIYHNDYAKTITVSKGADAVDMKLVEDSLKEDICITNDYGLATLGLAKGMRVVGFSGLKYTDFNIDSLLYSRFISQKIRASGARTKGPKKRLPKDDKEFRQSLIEVLNDQKN